jgi:hypothetical protein
VARRQPGLPCLTFGGVVPPAQRRCSLRGGGAACGVPGVEDRWW